MFENKTYQSNLLAYHGPIGIDLISTLGDYIKDGILKDCNQRTKIHKIFVELVQNVSYYSAKSDKILKNSRAGVGWVSIDDYRDSYLISTGNLILKEHGEILDRNCKEINSLNKQQLRILKRKTRGQANIRDIGAHIGLIQTGLLSDNPLKIEIDSIDNRYSFFKLMVEINKVNT